MIGVGRRKKDPAARPAYLSHFRLREAPFANGDERYFYADPERTQTLNMLLHLAQYSEELLVVTGPEGAGKSKLLDQFLARADEGWKVCRVGPDSAGDAGALFLHVARCFGLDPEQHPGDQLLEALRSHLEAMQTRELPVLVVDNADALSDDALEIIARLAALEGEHAKLVRTVLFAQPTLLDRFAEPRFESVPQPHRLELKPLDEQHTAAYIHHRLQAAGRSDGVPLGPRQVRRIHKLAGGWPGAINRLAHEALTARMEAERPRGLRRPALLLLLLGTGAALAAGGYWLQSHLASLGEFPPPETAEAPAPATPPSPERDGSGSAGMQPIERKPGKGGAPASPVVLLGGER
ncbi:MAG TPA: AAA family ATPase, partial [Gammaproteobacteria bacterium]|nr:AAA family ATPase [Gammaproteobacteria bacterium]